MTGVLLTEVKVRKLAEYCRHLNVFPIFLDQYTRETGKNPITPILMDLIGECTAALSLMDEPELQQVVDAMPSGLRMLIGVKDIVPEAVRSYIRRIALYYVVSKAQEHYLSFQDIVTSSQADGVVLRQYPELRTKFDEDSLLAIDDSFTLYDGGIGYKDHILQYHQFLRRGFTSNPNYDFLGRFIDYYALTKAENRFRIAIDHLRLMPKEFFMKIVELDRWFGPGFDEQKLDDPNSTGLTVMIRARPSLFDLTNQIDRTEFYWNYQDGIKSLEIEEVSSPKYTFGPYNINRYTHSERDMDARIFRHFDGAAKVYLQDQYQHRVEAKLPREPKSFRKIKLFRVDGDITLEPWLDLTAHFLKGNEMVIEYFDPELFKRTFGDRISAYERTKDQT